MLGDVEVDNIASLVSQHEEGVEDPKRCRRHGEEIDGGELPHMIVEECSPVLGRWLVVAEHVLRDRGLRDDDSDHLKFPVYMSSAPERILARELADKAADLRGSRGPACAPTASRFPRPVSAEALLVPAEQRVRLEDSNRGETAGPEPVQPNPEEALVTAGSEPFVVPGGDHCQ